MSRWQKWKGVKYVCFLSTFLNTSEYLIVAAESVGQSADGKRYSLVLFLDKFTFFLADGNASVFSRVKLSEAWGGWLQLTTSPCWRLWWEAVLYGAQRDYGGSQHCTNISQACSHVQMTHSNTSDKRVVQFMCWCVARVKLMLNTAPKNSWY